MYVTLGHVIETLEGKWLGDVLKEMIWQPLGMNSTYFGLDQAKEAKEHLAAGYLWGRQQKQHTAMPYMPLQEVEAASAMFSTVLDYAKWLKCLLDEAPPFSAAVHRDIKTSRTLQSPLPSVGFEAQAYGLGWQRTAF